MTASIRLGSSGRSMAAVGILCLMGALGCASSGGFGVAPGSEAWLSDVSVERVDGATIIALHGVEAATYRVQRASDPYQLTLELPAVRPDFIPGRMVVQDSLVDAIGFEEDAADGGVAITRVAIDMGQDFDFDVIPVDDRLEVRVITRGETDLDAPIDVASVEEDPDVEVPASSDEGMWEDVEPAQNLDEAVADSVEPVEEAVVMAVAEPASPGYPEDVWFSDDASEASEESEAQATEESVEVAASVDAEDMPKASQLLEVDVEGHDDTTMLRLRANGLVSDVKLFTLEEPQRLVIDLPGIENQIRKPNIDVGLPFAARIRIGQHPDKVRVVVDAGDGRAPFDAREVQHTPNGVQVIIGAAPLDEGAAYISELPHVGAADEEADPFADFENHDAGHTNGAEPVRGARIGGAPVPVEEADEPEAQMDVVAEPEVAVEAMDEAPAEIAEVDEVADAAPVEVVEEMPAEVEPAVVEMAEEMPAEVAPEVAPMDEPEVAQAGASADELPPVPARVRVETVELESLTDVDRIVIVTDAAGEPLPFELREPEAETVVLSLYGAELDDAAAVRLIPPSGGPVSLVSSFQQPEVTVPEVRVVITRSGNDQPQVRHEGNFVYVDFDKAAVEEVAEAGASPAVADEMAAVPAAPAEAPVADPTPPVSAVPPAPAALDDGTPIGILQEGGFEEGKAYVGRRISLDFKDAQIDDVLRLIAEVSDLNVIAGDEVAGRVTIRLVDVPWDQALDVILMTQGLGFERVGSVLRIAPADVLQAEKEARLQERRALEKLEDLVVKLQPVNYADVTEVSDLVGRLLSSRGSVDVDQRTSTIIMKDIPTVIDEATALIKAIDTQTPQVMIEAKIVEASLNFSRELGSEWGYGTQPEDGDTEVEFDDFTVGGARPITNFDITEFPYSYANNVVVTNPITASSTGLVNLGAFLLKGAAAVALRLQAAEARGEGKVISSPRVVTLDNREALIEQGVSIPFQTFENGDAQLSFVDAVLQLKVTPHITADKSIIMKIEVSRNAPDQDVSTPTGSPAISKNEASTEALVQDGQTLVIGGIYVIDKSENESGVPFLSNIPWLGAMFKTKAWADKREELLIFVTPRVVQAPEVAS